MSGHSITEGTLERNPECSFLVWLAIWQAAQCAEKSYRIFWQMVNVNMIDPRLKTQGEKAQLRGSMVYHYKLQVL